MKTPYSPIEDVKGFTPYVGQAFFNRDTRISFDDKVGNVMAHIMTRKNEVMDYPITIDLRRFEHFFEKAKDLHDIFYSVRPNVIFSGTRTDSTGNKHTAEEMRVSGHRLFLVMWFYSLDVAERHPLTRWLDNPVGRRPLCLRDLEYLYPELPAIENYYGTMRWRVNAEKFFEMAYKVHGDELPDPVKPPPTYEATDEATDEKREMSVEVDGFDVVDAPSEDTKAKCQH